MIMNDFLKPVMMRAALTLLLILAGSVTVSAQTVTSFPWTEDFNSLTAEGSIPAGWDNSEGTTGGTLEEDIYKWCYNSTQTSTGDEGVGIFGSCSGTSHDGSNCVRFESY